MKTALGFSLAVLHPMGCGSSPGAEPGTDTACPPRPRGLARRFLGGVVTPTKPQAHKDSLAQFTLTRVPLRGRKSQLIL